MGKRMGRNSGRRSMVKARKHKHVKSDYSKGCPSAKEEGTEHMKGPGARLYRI